jgi:hypothetical protein
MPATVIWKGNVPHRSSITVTVDDVGVAVVTEVWQCRDESMAKTVLNVTASDCPLGLPRPYVKSTSADRMEADTWQVTRTFSAVLDEGLIGQRKIYKCTTVANKEPIQTHPEFKKFAGVFGAPVNGAVFAEDGFERFKPYITQGEKYTDRDGNVQTATTTIKNRKCGVQDYLCPIVHLSETKLILKENLASEVKKLAGIDRVTPNTPLKPHWPKRTWLLTKADPQWVASDVYKLVREWSLSGPRGWDKDVYVK